MIQLRRTRTLKERLKTRIRRARGDVFVPRDFADLGEYDSVKEPFDSSLSKARSRVWATGSMPA
ncbi:hypothetical protein LV478_02295 (plasmid) [Komagataeibacter oboediens]|uniref:hypothetical protein n=1 Tax=Komagataeibacter oboediens TaxID=65958 RepID=UPI0023DB14C6|nr:hypothetical protein [Komagataeibacter oboediens]WEQ50965.1 hypothetical protein LV478_02295 [Komagataeibacter oboediens]